MPVPNRFILSLKQTALLYAMQLAKINDDIVSCIGTKSFDNKIKWRDRWKTSVELLFSRHVIAGRLAAGLSPEYEPIAWFEHNESALAAEIKKELAVSANPAWFGILIIETELFVPYFPLALNKLSLRGGEDIVTVSRSYIHVQYQKKQDWLEAFLLINDFFDGVDSLIRIRNSCRSSIFRITGHRNSKSLPALAAGLAADMSESFAKCFFPEMALRIFTGSVVRLSEEQIVSECLAYIGSGIVSEQSRPSPDAAAIAAGGILLSESTSSRASDLFLCLFALPSCVISQCAKLDTFLREILLPQSGSDRSVTAEILALFEHCVTLCEKNLQLREERFSCIPGDRRESFIRNTEISLSYIHSFDESLKVFCNSL